MVKIQADFCISHGDEMKIFGQAMWFNADSLPFIDVLYQRMSREMGFECLMAIERGDLSDSAHLVTHPEDR
jgi:hypothetical protein